MPKSRLRGAAAMLLALAATVAAPAPASAGEANEKSEEPATVDSNSIAREVREVVETNYVLAEKIAAVTAALDEGIATGRYAGLRDRELADRLNQDLASAAQDKHLAIQFDPAHASMLDGPMGDEVTEGPQWDRMARSRKERPLP